MISNYIKDKIEQVTGKQITGMHSVTGGCISQAFEINLEDGESLFLKVDPECCTEMFIKEANGLKELGKAKAIRTPKVIYAEMSFILLELIKPGKAKKNFFDDFGTRLALMHRNSSESFGFYENNFIGSSIQINIPEGSEAESWPDFYLNKRILFQYKLAEKNGYSTGELRKVINTIETKIYDILKGSEESPALLHGDLWSGNYITDESGTACLIDPAVYYGHREADLGMTKLFGGFSSEFYESYMDAFPLPDNYSERENIYKLYHALNHLNLFGNGYYNTSLALAKTYL